MLTKSWNDMGRSTFAACRLSADEMFITVELHSHRSVLHMILVADKVLIDVICQLFSSFFLSHGFLL